MNSEFVGLPFKFEMVYEKYFDSKYLETDKRRQELERLITVAFRKDDFAAVDKLCLDLETTDRF